jgi:hypothetical protein
MARQIQNQTVEQSTNNRRRQKKNRFFSDEEFDRAMGKSLREDRELLEKLAKV